MAEAGDTPIPTVEQLQELDKVEREREVSDVGSIFKKNLQNQGEFSETVYIDKRGQLIPYDEQYNTKSLFVLFAYEDGAEGLYKLANEVQGKFPDLSINFEPDPEGQWIKYSVHGNSQNTPESSKPQTPSEEEQVEEGLLQQYGEDYSWRTAETGRFSERINILPNGQLDWGSEQEGLKIIAHMPNVEYPEGTQGIYMAANRVQTRFPEFGFTFKRDPEGKWIEYTVVNAKVVPASPVPTTPK